MTPEQENVAPEGAIIESTGFEPRGPRRRWYHRLASLAWIVFCFELGAFLLVYPWMDEWGLNFLSGGGIEVLRAHWESPYLRGAVSGLGIVNIYIALNELFNFLKQCFFE